jgi:hypothetical protein
MNEADDYMLYVHHMNEDEVIMILKYVYDTCAL